MITSVQKVTNILSTVARKNPSPTPLCEIAEKTGINKSTCSHIINTLLQEGFLVKISASKGYILGPATYYLTDSERYKNELITLCHPIMQYLHKTLGYCVVLAISEGNEKYIIDYLDNNNVFKGKKKILKDRIYGTATGRVIIKHMSRDKIVTLWEKCGPPTKDEWTEITCLEELLSYWANTPKENIVFTRSQNSDGYIYLGYALPIKNSISCVGAIGIAVKLFPEDEKKFMIEEDQKIKTFLIKGTNLLNKHLRQRQR